jgi:hypothetical protein
MFRQAARQSTSGRQMYRQAHAGRQTNVQTGTRSRQTNVQTGTPGRQIHRRADIQMYTHTDTQTHDMNRTADTDKKAYSQAGHTCS